ncbi:hypothetical protein BDZ89DRAFT_1135556 [Hymenopellis radicata]|nr:hypothetical protein BDZ89DRAFT_1135556 [Hymenopellis radicata]
MLVPTLGHSYALTTRYDDSDSDDEWTLLFSHWTSRGRLLESRLLAHRRSVMTTETNLDDDNEGEANSHVS